MSDWFLTGGAGPDAAARVFCFVHAGGNPRLFLDWQRHLPDAELVAVCAPGQGPRAAEPAQPIEELIDGAAAAIRDSADRDPRPSYLFGHSLGGLIAFEVARRLRDVPAVRHLVASGISAPSLLPSRRVRELAGKEGREFVEGLVFFGGVPEDVLAEPDVLELLLPALIADFRRAVGYRYRPAKPLEVGVSLVVGRDDPHVGVDQLRPWERECARPPVCHRPPGGHFYFAGRPESVTDILRALVVADQYVEMI